jgi:hypothetical protein
VQPASASCCARASIARYSSYYTIKDRIDGAGCCDAASWGAARSWLKSTAPQLAKFIRSRAPRIGHAAYRRRVGGVHPSCTPLSPQSCFRGTRIQLYSSTADGGCVRTGGFGGVLTRVAPSVLFGIFQKVIANLVRYMQMLTLSSRHARSPALFHHALNHTFLTATSTTTNVNWWDFIMI